MNSILSPALSKSFVARTDFPKDYSSTTKPEPDDTTLSSSIRTESNGSLESLSPIQLLEALKQKLSISLSDETPKTDATTPSTRLKVKPTIILTPSPTCSQINQPAKVAFDHPTQTITPKETLPQKQQIPSETTGMYPDLIHDKKVYKFFDWKVVAKMCWVAPFNQPPTGIFYHSEDDYLVYFGKQKNSAGNTAKNAADSDKLRMNEEIEAEYEGPTKKDDGDDEDSDAQERSTEDIDSDVKSKREDKISEILNNLQHSFSHRIIGENMGSLTVKPSQDVLDLLKKQVEERARSQMKGRDDGVSLSCVRSNFTKNLPKKIGDQFADYLTETYHVNMSKVFKDKMSWKVLNSYLEGQKALEEGKIGTRALIQSFIDFIVKYEMKQIDESRTRDDVSKQCYKVTIKSLKAAFDKLSTYVNLRQIKSLSIAKSWPLLDIHYMVEENAKGK